VAFGGLQPCSLIDYPGRVSCVLFLRGCNLHCPYCHNPDLVRRQGCRQPDMATLEAFLDRRQGFLDAVVISGGEPTLWPGLESLCRRIKAKGLAVKLDTNGSRPRVLRQLLSAGLLDYVAMDVKADPERYAPLLADRDLADDLKASIRLLAEAGCDHEFRTTCIAPLVDVDTIGRLARLLAGAPLYALQAPQPGVRVLDPEFYADPDRFFPAQVLAEMQATAGVWVDRCILR
jgi:pyruvate formate lyase activating enzyme